MTTALEWMVANGFASFDVEALQDAPEPVRLELAALLNQWRPIETAPKDGTRFLAFASDDEIGIVSILHRHDPGGQERNPRYNFECWVTDFNSPSGPPPTKWLPLPEAPK